MKFTVAAALLVSSALAVPTSPNYGGGACVPNGNHPGDNTSSGSYPGGRNNGGNPSGTSSSATSSGAATTGVASSSSGYASISSGHTSSSSSISSGHTTTSSSPASISSGHTSFSSSISSGHTTTSSSSSPATTSSGPSTSNPGTPGIGNICPSGLYSVPQCCSVDVLGVVDLDCGSPNGDVSSLTAFHSTCSASGKEARCCVIPVLGQDVLCEPAAGHAASSPSGQKPGGDHQPGNGQQPGEYQQPDHSTPNKPSGGNHVGDVCPKGLYSVPQCCSVDVLGVVDLDCGSPDGDVSNLTAFHGTCSASGKEARCCVLPVLGQDVLCVKPSGI